jgi:REP element-mobilizing transposase RayT
MPRRARLFVPGCLHHVMSRGLDGMDLFRDDEDRLFFLKLVEQYIKRADMRCYAWVLMRNHYHFVLRSSELPLSTCADRQNRPWFSGYKNGFASIW